MKVKIPPKVTASAFNKIMSIGGKKCLRVAVEGGGCSGFQYVWEVTDKEPTVANVHIDHIAEMYVIGCTIDYVKELGGSYLKVINPNATASCGCGESFAV